jgi:hypothetical protein
MCKLNIFNLIFDQDGNYIQAGLVYLTQMLCQNKTQVKLTFGFGLHMQSVVKSQTYVDIL